MSYSTFASESKAPWLPYLDGAPRQRTTASPASTDQRRTEGYICNAVIVYQDGRTRQWARQVCARAEQVLGRSRVQASWWDIHDLSTPVVLSAALSSAVRSDLIVVAVDDRRPLPLGFYLWADLWLPFGPRDHGALVALIGRSEPGGAEPGRTSQFFRALAERAHLNFTLQERKIPAVRRKKLAPARAGNSGFHGQEVPGLLWFSLSGTPVDRCCETDATTRLAPPRPRWSPGIAS